MIYGYGFYYKIYMELLHYLPSRQILNIAKDYKLLKMAQPSDLVFFFNWSEHSRKIQKELADKGVELFPRIDVSFFVGNKIEQLRKLQSITKYSLMREYIEIAEPTEVTVPRLGEHNKTVLKIGNDHQGMNKFLKNSGEQVVLKKSSIFEEYLRSSRSIRVLAITRNVDDIFIVEHVNSDEAKLDPNTSWIKNINPIETVYPYRDRYKLNIPEIDSIIEDTLTIMNFFNHDYMGMDYVVSEQKIGFLEANDMIGLPDDNEVYEKAIRFFKEIADAHYHSN